MRSERVLLLVTLLLSALVVVIKAQARFPLASSPAPRTKPAWAPEEGFDIDLSFDDFKKLFKNKTKYSPEEETMREQMFTDNLNTINAFNRNPLKTWRMSVNTFTDFTPKEFGSLCGCREESFIPRRLGLPFQPKPQPAMAEIVEQTGAPPDESIDYSKDPCMGSVGFQGVCGSCWSFAAVNVAEFNYCKKKNNGKYQQLSKQQLVDCSAADKGCMFGWTANAFQYMIENGVTTETAYAYSASEMECAYGAIKPLTVKPIVGYARVPTDEDQMRIALRDHGPLAVVIYATDLEFYYDGIIMGEACKTPDGEDGKPMNTNHAVVVVGFGYTDDGTAFWKLKNCWGNQWGEEGYFRLEAYAPYEKGCLQIASAPLYVY